MLVTVDGWVKRQKEIKEPGKSRIREGDRVLACVAGSTRATVGFFSSLGTCFTARFIDLPASTGHGEPIQKMFKLKDRETHRRGDQLRSSRAGRLDRRGPQAKPDVCPMLHGFAATTDGYALRFGLEKLAEVSSRSGRRFARPVAGQEVIGVVAVDGNETILAISERCRAIVCSAS